jgi:hypothetical protein
MAFRRAPDLLEAMPQALGVAFTINTLTERQSLSARNAAEPPALVLGSRLPVHASFDFDIKRHQQHGVAALRVVHQRHEAQRALRIFR